MTRKSFTSATLYVFGAAGILLGYLFPYNLPPITTAHMEIFFAIGWILLISAYLLDVGSTRVHLPKLTWLALALPLSLAFAAFVDFAFGRNEYGGLVILYGVYLALAVSAIWIGSEVASRSNEASSRRLLLIFAAIICSAALLNGIAGVIQIAEWHVSPWLVVRLPASARAYGNIRQPNQYSLLLTLGVVAAMGLAAAKYTTSSNSTRAKQLGFLTLAGFLGVASSLSASRTGLLLIVVVALLSLIGAGLSGLRRAMAVVAALANVAGWLVFSALGQAGQVNYSGLQRMDMSGGADFSSRRDDLWWAMLDLIREHPIWGSGFGRLNYEYFNLDLPNRLDFNLQNAHNLPLQIAVEHGVIFALAWLAIMGIVLWKARRTWNVPQARLFWLGLVAVGIHSCLELPLWYLYFLLPTGFALGAIAGFAKPADLHEAQTQPSMRPLRPALIGIGAFVSLFAAWGIWNDYSRILPTFVAGTPAQVMDRFESGYRSRLFTPWMDYAVVANTPVTPENAKLHYRISKRVSTFTIQSFIVINLALSSSMLERPEEAAFYLHRLKGFYGSKFEPLIASLTPEEREILKPALVMVNKKNDG